MAKAAAPQFPLTQAQVQTTLASIAYAGDTLKGAHPTLAESLNNLFMTLD